jgi:hypothetical protein
MRWAVATAYYALADAGLRLTGTNGRSRVYSMEPVTRAENALERVTRRFDSHAGWSLQPGMACLARSSSGVNLVALPSALAVRRIAEFDASAMTSSYSFDMSSTVSAAAAWSLALVSIRA